MVIVRGADLSHRTTLVELAGLVVEVNATSAVVHSVIGDFYRPPADPDAIADWTVTAVASAAPGGVARNAHGVGYRAVVAERAVTLWSPNEVDLAVTTRKVVRELFLDVCERAGYTMLHASAIYRDDQVVVFAADKRAGKTTLALRAVIEHGWRWLSNDHLIVYRTSRGLVVTSLPTPIPVKVGTLVNLDGRLPAPWDSNGVDIARWKAVSAEERYASDVSVYYTFGQLGQDNPVLLTLEDSRLTLVFPRYGDPGRPVGAGEALSSEDAQLELAVHVRTDWVADERLHQRHLPLAHRDLSAFASDGTALAAELAAAAHGALRWDHLGDPGPLLAGLTRADGVGT